MLAPWENGGYVKTTIQHLNDHILDFIFYILFGKVIINYNW